MKAVALLVLFLGVLAGCDVIFRSGGDHLKEDMKELFARANILKSDLTCRTSRQTRAGSCEGSMTPDEVDRIISTLRLIEVENDGAQDKDYQSWKLSEMQCFVKGSQTQVFKSQRRAPQLRMSDGMAFEYLLLFHSVTSSHTCIHVQYAYG